MFLIVDFIFVTERALCLSILDLFLGFVNTGMVVLAHGLATIHRKT